jgi:hypothetical protein
MLVPSSSVKKSKKSRKLARKTSSLCRKRHRRGQLSEWETANRDEPATPSLTNAVTVSTCITWQTPASDTAIIGNGATLLLPIARALCTGTQDTGRTITEVPVVARRTQLKCSTLTYLIGSHKQ